MCPEGGVTLGVAGRHPPQEGPDGCVLPKVPEEGVLPQTPGSAVCRYGRFSGTEREITQPHLSWWEDRLASGGLGLTLPSSCSCSGILNPLDSPHHMRQDEDSEFREGVVVDRPTKAGQGSLVNCGMKKVGTGSGLWSPFRPLASYARQVKPYEWGALDPGLLCNTTYC